MSDKPGSKPPPPRIDAVAKARFLAALRRGERREDAAAAVGFSLVGLYGARRRDPDFAARWAEALAASAAAERRPGSGPAAAPERGEVRIASANRRIYQRRRRRNVRFDADRQALVLAHFAASCDTAAAAAAAGVHKSTVSLHRRADPVFAEAYREALARGYAALEAETVRRRLAAQARLRAAIEAADAHPRQGESLAKAPACPLCETDLRAEADAEFDRIIKLLDRHDRRARRAECGFKPGGRRREWTFDRAIELLDCRLRALGARTAPPRD